MLILSIDLGKYNSMCCFFDTATQKPVFTNTPTTREAITTLLKQRKFDLIVMEACGPSGWISDVCHQLGFKTLVCSTNEEAWQWKNVKRKTDKDDALRLARMVQYTLQPLGQTNLRTDPRRPGHSQEEGGNRASPQDRGGRLGDDAG